MIEYFYIPIIFYNERIIYKGTSMVCNLIKILITLSFTTSILYCANATRFNVVEGFAGEKFELALGENFEKATGFSVSDTHKRINDAYAKRYGNREHLDYDEAWDNNLDNLGFFAMSNDSRLNSILKTAPQIAAFAPFNQLMYKKTKEDMTFIGHMDPETMLNIVGVEDIDIRQDFISMFDPLDKWINEEFGGKVAIATYDSLPLKPMMNFEIEFDTEEDLSEYLEKFQEKFEFAFEDKKYIIAGFKNFKENYEDLGMEFNEYDAFFVYSLCHFTFSYNIFNKGRPDIGVFAPCSMYMYIKKDSNTMMIGMPKLSNWVAVMNITEIENIESIEKMDSEIILIMKSLGAKEI